MGFSLGFFEGSRNLLTSETFMRKLDAFLDTRLAPFSAEEAFLSLDKKASEKDLAWLEEYLSSSPLVFRIDSGEDEGRWLTRAGLFQGKKLAVMLTKAELAAGVFIPASRCIPFANPRLLPGNFRFYSGGKSLPRTVVDWDESEAAQLYFLFGVEFAPQIMEMDKADLPDDPSAPELGESDGTFPLKAIDMREFYWKRQARPGDCLILTVKNWARGHFSVQLRSKSKGAEGIEKWRGLFSRFLDKSFSVAGPCGSIEEQLAWAFFEGRDELFSLPPDDILNAIALSKSAGFFPYGVETRLWREGADFPVPKTWEDWLCAVVGGESASVFAKTAFPATDEVLEAYVMDSLRRGEESPDALLERLHEANGGAGAGVGDLALRGIVSQEFRLLRPSYNVFEDGSCGHLRSRIVDCYSRIVSLVRWCQSAGASPEDVNTQDVLVLAQLAEQLVICMEAFCISYYGESGNVPLEAVEGMEEALFDLEISIKNAAENHRRMSRGK